ncbi:hypothetical protein B0H14DRAFT_2566122 [Mycena olivaceomarginata]|nr:hypothetical protein B0H14DRAFT_2566122 [Mycena olivaceomarginata]
MAKAKSRKRDNDATEDASRKKNVVNRATSLGARLAFVTEHIPEYLAASKTEGLAGFLAWTQQKTHSVALGLNLTPEEEQKSKIQMKTKGKIKRWFSRRRSGGMGIQGNPYFGFLSKLWHHNDSIAPRRPSDFQFYMRHDDYKDAVMQQYIERYGDQPKDKQLALHCKVAIKMLAEEPDKVKEWLVAECDAAHAEDLEVFKEKEEPEPDADEEIQRKCHENFLPIVQPLLAGLHAYTGLTLNIIGGRINEETQQFKTDEIRRGIYPKLELGVDWEYAAPMWELWTARIGRGGIRRDTQQRSRQSHKLVNSSASASTSAIPPAAPTPDMGLSGMQLEY